MATRAREHWLAVAVFAAACAKIGGFEDYSNDGAPPKGGSAGADDAGAGQGGSLGGSAGAPVAAGRGGASGKAGSKSGGGSGGGGGNGGSSNAAAGGAGGTVVAAGGTGQGGGSASGGSAGLPDAGQGNEPPIGGAGGGPANILDQCVLLMHFEEPSWSGTPDEVLDSSGSGNHGTSSSPTLTTSGPSEGKFGRAALFDGSGQVTVPDAPSLHASDAVTLAAWIYPTYIAGSGPGIIVKRKSYGSNTAYTLFVWSDSMPEHHLYADLGGEANRLYSNGVVEAGAWYHVAAVFDATLPEEQRVRLYIDGALDREGPATTSAIAAYTSNLAIGNLPGGGATFEGYIDEAAVWTRALSAAEIQSLFQATGPL